MFLCGKIVELRTETLNETLRLAKGKSDSNQLRRKLLNKEQNPDPPVGGRKGR
jgi:hypothetical protein